MLAKRTAKRFCKRDVNVSLLDEETAACLTDGKIFINELLNREKFRNLKSVAQGLGFKYICHRQGNFLVRWLDGVKSHIIGTAADLQAIQASYANRQMCSAATDHSKSSSVATPLPVNSEKSSSN